MSITTLDTPVRLPPVGSARRVTFPRVLKSEWIKLRTLRSSWYTLLGAVVAMTLIGLLIGANVGKHGTTIKPADVAASGPLRGYFFAQLLIAVLGVMFVTSEYGTGQIRSTFAAVPRRLPVIGAKAVVFGAFVLVAMTIASFVTYFGAEALISSAHHTTLSAPGALRAVAGTGLYLALIGILAGAVGWIIRSTAGAIAGILGLLLVIPIVVSVLPGSLSTTIGEYLPNAAGSSFITSIRASNSLAPVAGLAILVLWVLGALAIASVVARRRDA